MPDLSSEVTPSKKDIEAVILFASKISQYRSKNKSKFNFEIRKYMSPNWAKKLLKQKSYIISSDNFSIENNIIPLQTIEMFKGLETDMLILFINHVNKDVIKELYVGASRAVAYLHILINQDVFEKINQLKD